MFRRTIMMRIAVAAALLLSGVMVLAQTVTTPPRKQGPPAASERRPAPQVVTIIHRLNGLKMFRLLLRSEQQAQEIAGLNLPFNLTDDVHTSVIAGLAMDDGETIAAWLPEAEVEFGPATIPTPTTPTPAPAAPAPFPSLPVPPTFPQTWTELKGDLFNPPDVTVIGPDGKQLVARYVGFDATTGLSILRLAGKDALPSTTIKDEPIGVGENVLLFGPEPVTSAQALLNNSSLYVRIGSIKGRIQNVLPAPSGEVARFKVRSPRLSRANIGGVAVNEAGDTLGIIDGLEGTEASVLPAAAIRRAVRRVLEQQASVPRPWLGVKGEAVAALKLDQILNHGWGMDRATALAGQHRGILLTSVVPGSPAALAALRAGDVILKVDDKEIQNADDFTWWLEQAGPSQPVRLTVARPNQPAEEALSVKLSGMRDPAVATTFRNRSPRGVSLIDRGIETIALGPIVAAQLQTTPGLLVVYVEPATPGFEAGLQPGDVIQTIDGKPASFNTRPLPPDAPLTLEVMRKKKKLVLTLKK